MPAMDADPDSFACYPLSVGPPEGQRLAIYAESSGHFSEWFEGMYDGKFWKALDMPKVPHQWYVRGWRPLHQKVDARAVDGRTLLGSLEPVVPPLLWECDALPQ